MSDSRRLVDKLWSYRAERPWNHPVAGATVRGVAVLSARAGRAAADGVRGWT